LETASSNEAILPSASAIPTAMLTMDFAIEWETEAMRGVRSY